MKILSLDTSTKFLCLGLSEENRIYEYRMEMGVRLSSLLVPAIKRVLESLKWRIKYIDYFASALGPGSFTGVRVGLAAIKGMSWSVNKPVIGISSLDILANNVFFSKEIFCGAGQAAKGKRIFPRFVIPLIDAKRKLMYCAIYTFAATKPRPSGRGWSLSAQYSAQKGNPDFSPGRLHSLGGGILKRISPYMLLTQDELFNKIKRYTGSKRRNDIIMLGDALGLYGEEIVKETSVIALDKDYWYPQPRNIIRLAKEKIKNKEQSDAFVIKPLYLYPKECQIRK